MNESQPERGEFSSIENLITQASENLPDTISDLSFEIINGEPAVRIEKGTDGWEESAEK